MTVKAKQKVSQYAKITISEDKSLEKASIPHPYARINIKLNLQLNYL
jgi:hypothetical protein